MGLVEKWNKFAKKRIYINDTLEIGCGRLVFMGLIVMFQVLGIMCCNNWVVTPEIFFVLSTFIGSFKKVKKEKES